MARDGKIRRIWRCLEINSTLGTKKIKPGRGGTRL